MSDYPLCTLKRAKKSGRRKGDSLRPSAAESPPAKGRPGCRKGWNKTRRFPAQGRRAAAEYGAPVRPQKSLAGKMTHLSTPFSFWGQYSTKKAGRQEKSWAGRRGDADWGGLTTRLRAPAGTPPRAACRPPLHTMGKVQIYSAGAYSAEGSPAGSRPRPTNRRKRHIVLQTFRQVVGAACMPPGRRSCGNAVLRADSPFSDVP